MDQHQDNSSHYEVSLTAGQAVIAFVLLLFSLGASFAFGIVVGKGGGDDRLLARRDTAVVSEAASAAGTARPRIVELGVNDPPPASSVILDTAQPAADPAPADPQPVVTEDPPPATEPPPASEPRASEAGEPFFAQVLSTTEAQPAEALAAKLIDSGFTSAYVEKGSTERGTVFRVRVKFPNEGAARAAVGQLAAFTNGEVWITNR